MSEPQWYDACAIEACPVGQGIEVVVGEEIVALFHTEQGWYALQGTCPHHGGPLGQGELDGCVVTCPWHGWQFDVRDGTYQHSQQLQHRGFPVKVEQARVWVGLET